MHRNITFANIATEFFIFCWIAKPTSNSIFKGNYFSVKIWLLTCANGCGYQQKKKRKTESTRRTDIHRHEHNFPLFAFIFGKADFEFIDQFDKLIRMKNSDKRFFTHFSSFSFRSFSFIFDISGAFSRIVIASLPFFSHTRQKLI